MTSKSQYQYTGVIPTICRGQCSAAWDFLWTYFNQSWQSVTMCALAIVQITILKHEMEQLIPVLIFWISR